ncbi:hypothetical protein QUA62_28220, partial [Microcoleus sp. MON1_C1]|uniref:hypothetical protein n=1 Tax=Microcoleus sp. MON1_C1 TaxID=2818827 RepID=UPI002FD4D20A
LIRNILKTGLLIAATVPHNIRKCCSFRFSVASCDRPQYTVSIWQPNARAHPQPEAQGACDQRL